MQHELAQIQAEFEAGSRTSLRTFVQQQHADASSPHGAEGLPVRSASLEALGAGGPYNGPAGLEEGPPSPQPIPWISAADRLLQTYKEGEGNLGTVAQARRFTMPQQPPSEGATAPPSPPSRAMWVPERVDAELAGLVYDLVHLAHEELIVVRDGPLPGAGDGPGPRQVREAALRRLQGKPVEVQKHVRLLEAAKKQLGRLVRGQGGEGRDTVKATGVTGLYARGLYISNAVAYFADSDDDRPMHAPSEGTRIIYGQGSDDDMPMCAPFR